MTAIRMRFKIYNLSMVLIAIALIVAGGLIIFDGQAFGFGHMIGKFLFPLLFGYFVAWGITRNPARKEFRSSIALSIAVVLFFAFNVDRAYLALEAIEAKRILSEVAGPKSLKKILSENSDNRVLRNLVFVIKAARESSDELVGLIAGLEPAALDSPLPFEKASLVDLKELRAALKIAEINALSAESQVNFILTRERARVVDYMKAQKFSSDFKQATLAGLEKRQRDYRDLYKKVSKLKQKNITSRTD